MYNFSKIYILRNGRWFDAIDSFKGIQVKSYREAQEYIQALNDYFSKYEDKKHLIITNYMFLLREVKE